MKINKQELKWFLCGDPLFVANLAVVKHYLTEKSQAPESSLPELPVPAFPQVKLRQVGGMEALLCGPPGWRPFPGP